MGKSHFPDLGSKRSLSYNTHTQQQKGGLHLPLQRYEFACRPKGSRPYSIGRLLQQRSTILTLVALSTRTSLQFFIG